MRVLLLVLCLSVAHADPPPPLQLSRVLHAGRDADIRGGGLLARGKLITWGRDLLEWDLASGKHRRLAHGPFEAGCVAHDGVVVQQAGNILARRRPPDWRPEFIDNNIYLSECVWTTLLGHPGLVLIHRNAQVRHYTPPPRPSAAGSRVRWEYQEIYSIYTASRQTGLAIADVDLDGRADIFCGNYWIQSPVAYGLPWRLFAIQPYYKEADAATVALIPIWGGLAVGQRERAEPLFSLFTPGSDVHQLWTETPLPGPVRRPSSLIEWGGGLLVAENTGPGSRILWLATRSEPFSVVASASGGVRALLRDGDGAFGLEATRVLVLQPAQP